MIVSILLFLLVLAVLIFVHELGHFIVAKLSGIRVDEFALGFPPRLWSFRRGETQYSINLIPFGGYVKIFGENPDEDSISGPESSRSFVNKPKYTQAIVLVAGVTFNVLFAWLLFSGSLMSGLQAPVGYLSVLDVKDAHVVITDVLPNSPAAAAGLAAGDKIESISSNGQTLTEPNLKVTDVQDLTAKSNGEPIDLGIQKNNQPLEHVMVTAKSGLVPNKLAIGISMDMVGVLKENPISALIDGAKITGVVIEQTSVGLGSFLINAVTGHADFSQIVGPVGIVGYVGEAYSLGILYLIAFTSLISINLAIINLLPFPALDGGRLLFVLIEAIKGSPIKPKIANALNNVGFALLILLMVIVTYHDIAKFFIR
jgi:regulator of sigma E protease